MNLEENLREIAEYFDIEFNSILNNYNQVKAKYPGFVKWSNLSAEEWNKKKNWSKWYQWGYEFLS